MGMEKERNMKMAVEIFFDDLSEEKQKEVLEECGISELRDGNFAMAPITIFEVDEEVRKEIIEEQVNQG